MLDQGKTKDRRDAAKVGHDPAEHSSLAGSGSTSKGDFGVASSVNDIGESGGADPVVGSLSAFGGIGNSHYSNPDSKAAVVSGPSIDKPGYPMAGEGSGGSQPGSKGVKGSMDKGGSHPDRTMHHPSHPMKQPSNV